MRHPLHYALAIVLWMPIAANAAGPGTSLKEQEAIRALQAKQAQLLAEVREGLAAQPQLPDPTADEPEYIQSQRLRRQELADLLAVIEARIQDEDRTKFVDKNSGNAIYRAYYFKIQRVIESRTKPFVLNGKPATGKAIVTFFIDPDGRVQSIDVRDSSSNEFTTYVTQLLHKMPPLPAFPKGIPKSVNTIVVTSTFAYVTQ